MSKQICSSDDYNIRIKRVSTVHTMLHSMSPAGQPFFLERQVAFRLQNITVYQSSISYEKKKYCASKADLELRREGLGDIRTTGIYAVFCILLVLHNSEIKFTLSKNIYLVLSIYMPPSSARTYLGKIIFW